MSEIKIGSKIIDVYGQEGLVVGILREQKKALIQYKEDDIIVNQKWRDIDSLLITEQ